ncbi:protein-tyrosine phosphatase [Mycetocola sp. BIGb0189]|uniref:tyrosine-protein phosphatase n=1 Tax=Mycetocola sp. BIGb0189 TaxID=2940604 RepID=UPI0021670C7C|nr:tyrosine-protein phosphatase [Mycetocola sp. BIGb0189]MCS4274950.1 protein-tyrosine phosphatase [Mycetocola sp. BIGb0189]
MSHERIALSATFNTRETAGLPVRGGGVIRPNVLWRSDAVPVLTEADLALLDGRLHTVIDLRSETERASLPSALEAIARELHRIDLAAGALPSGGASGEEDPTAAMLAQIPSLETLYRGILTEAGPVIAEIARAVIAAAPHGATLIHCTAGKDRTGVSVALLLDAVGTERAAVVENYAQTAENLAGEWAERMFAAITAHGVPLTEGIRALVSASPAEVMAELLVGLDAEYPDASSGARGYLAVHGLTEAELAELDAALVAPTLTGPACAGYISGVSLL